MNLEETERETRGVASHDLFNLTGTRLRAAPCLCTRVIFTAAPLPRPREGRGSVLFKMASSFIFITIHAFQGAKEE